MSEPIVTPIQGQPLCFLVRSRTNPETQYTVNWPEHFCTCPSFHKTAAKHFAMTARPLVCWHMEQARDLGWANYVETCRELMLSQ